ncbi:MAG: cytochrome c [Candidatus Desantisbacteria bacterium]
MKEMKHLTRGMGLALLVIIIFTIVRTIVVPDSFGKYGYYRAEAVSDEMSIHPLYQGAEACKKCHEPRHKEWSSGKHGGVNCEDCHGAAMDHVTKTCSATDTVAAKKTITVNQTKELCLQCHLQLSGRPDKSAAIPQPQINIEKHLKGKKETQCFKCHNPHHPDLKQPEPEPENAVETIQTAAVSAIGKKVYQDTCLVCHGAKGDGKTEVAETLTVKLPDFSRKDIGFEQMVNSITKGKGDQMPAYKDELSAEQIKEAAKYIQSLRR